MDSVKDERLEPPDDEPETEPDDSAAEEYDEDPVSDQEWWEREFGGQLQ